jgi:RNA polymerase sigma factor (sigma-70 family)
MRQVLVDFSRKRAASKRSADAVAIEDVTLTVEERRVNLLDLDLALTRLEQLDARKVNILEHIYFGGLGVVETGASMGLSESTVRRELRLGEAWLLRELANQSGQGT